MLEYLVSPRRARHEPWDFFFMALIFVSAAVSVTILIPGLDGGIIVFAMVPAIPLLWSFLAWDEKQEIEKIKEAHLMRNRFLHHHRPLIEAFAFFFLGATLAYAFFAAILPPENSEKVFANQFNELEKIRALATGRAFSQENFRFLFEHNLTVLGLMFVFCLIYGIGSVYLLLWNASVIGAFVGKQVASQGPLGAINGFFGLVPHGSFEILAYLLASIAGGIFSVAIMKGHWQKAEFKYIAIDVLALTAASITLLFIGAAIEASY